MWELEGSGPYHEYGEVESGEWHDEGDQEWDWEEIKEEPCDDESQMEPEPRDPWDDDPQNRWHSKSQPYEAYHAPPPPPPPPPPAAEGSQQNQQGWSRWEGWSGRVQDKTKNWDQTHQWKPKWGNNWKPWKPSKAPWSGQKKSKPDGNYTKGGGFTDHDGTWWPFLDSGLVFYSSLFFAVFAVLNRFEYHHQIVSIDFVWFTLWLFTIAMDNGLFIDDFPIEPSIYE